VRTVILERFGSIEVGVYPEDPTEVCFIMRGAIETIHILDAIDLRDWLNVQIRRCERTKEAAK
jgi:hypothetical protein